ncbi:MAG: hypothetical protein QOJ99_371 [Bryobacterales bacterium]|jgi:hypothetical protein|nr:hypothetical protein [Bryobacterales bacterium]
MCWSVRLQASAVVLFNVLEQSAKGSLPFPILPMKFEIQVKGALVVAGFQELNLLKGKFDVIVDMFQKLSGDSLTLRTVGYVFVRFLSVWLFWLFRIHALRHPSAFFLGTSGLIAEYTRA